MQLADFRDVLSYSTLRMHSVKQNRASNHKTAVCDNKGYISEDGTSLCFVLGSNNHSQLTHLRSEGTLLKLEYLFTTVYAQVLGPTVPLTIELASLFFAHDTFSCQDNYYNQNVLKPKLQIKVMRLT